MSSWSPSLPAVSAESLSQVSEGGPLAVVLLWAIWDPACRRLDTWLQQAAADYPNLHFYAMDLDQEQNWPTAKEWGITDTRTLVCLLNGVFHALLTGAGPEPRLRAKLAEWNNLHATG